MESVRTRINKVLNAIQELEDFCLSGDELAHECYSEVKHFELDNAISSMTEKIRDGALEELRNNFLEGNEKSYKGKNFVYTIRNGATRYYFTNVPEVKRVKAELERSEPFKKVKETENKYKTAFLLKLKGQTIVDEETGELIDPSDVNVVYSADSISLKQRNDLQTA